MSIPDEPQLYPSLFTLLNGALARRAIILRSAVAGVVITLLVGLLTREYDARARLVAQQPRGALGALAGFAAQVGIPVGTEGASDSPQYFAEYLRSRDVLDTLVQLEFASRSADGHPMRLAEILGLDSKRDARDLKIKAVDELRSRISTRSDLSTGMISVRVRMPEAGLAEDVLAQLIAVAERNNRIRKGGIATAEREFVEERLATAARELSAAQDSLEEFLVKNRSFRGSARLELQAQNLQRTVELRQAVVVSLSQALETARIEEVRNTPLLSMIEAPINSAEPSAKITFLVAIGVLAGSVVGACFLMVVGLIDHGRERNPHEMETLRNLALQTLRDPFGRKT